MERSRGDRQPAIEGQSGVVRGCAIETAPVRSFLDVVGQPRIAWASGKTTIVAGGQAATVTASGGDRFDTVRRQAEELFGALDTPAELPDVTRPRLFGGFAFTSDHSDEDTVWSGYPSAEFVLPAIQLTTTPDGAWLTTAAVGSDAEQRTQRRLSIWRNRVAALPELSTEQTPGVTDHTYTPSRPTWREQIASATARIQRGHLRKVVLAQSLSVRLRNELSIPDVLARLGDVYPSCHRFLFDPAGGNAFFGATPERLVSLRGQTVDTEALAGSIGRGETSDEDEWLASQLQDSEKNTHEHALVVEAIRDQLSTLTADIETGTRTVRKLSNVQHLQTPIRASLSDDEHVLSLVKALHPTPAVGGLPPDEALRTIRDSEAFDRGWYAAPVGWLDSAGDGTFVVAIRSGVVDTGDGTDRQATHGPSPTATLFAGAGIVPDSDPDHEWDELQLKYRPILDQLD